MNKNTYEMIDELHRLVAPFRKEVKKILLNRVSNRIGNLSFAFNKSKFFIDEATESFDKFSKSFNMNR